MTDKNVVEESYWDWLPPEIKEQIHVVVFNAQLKEMEKVVKRTNPKVKFMVPLKGQVAKKWGSSCVWQAPDGAIYGLHLNIENEQVFIFLGWTEAQALQRVHFVKSFL